MKSNFDFRPNHETPHNTFNCKPELHILGIKVIVTAHDQYESVMGEDGCSYASTVYSIYMTYKGRSIGCMDMNKCCAHMNNIDTSFYSMSDLYKGASKCARLLYLHAWSNYEVEQP